MYFHLRPRPIIRNISSRCYVSPRVRRTAPCRASLSEVLITQSYLIGKGLTLFVLFTAALNYLYYRRIREDYENRSKNDKEKD